MDVWNVVQIFYLVMIAITEGVILKQIGVGLTVFPNITPPGVTSYVLTNNKLTFIPDYAIENSDVTSLFLSGNSISSFSEEAFNGTRLNLLFLDNNPIKTVPFFRHVDGTLSHLSFKSCSITNETWDLIMPYSKIQGLALSNNDLKHMPDLSKTKASLKGLVLESCGIAEIKPFYFTGFDKLFSLNLAKNKFVTLKDNTFVGLSALTHLDLTLSKLETLPCVAPFSPLLKRYHVSGNKIEKFSSNCSGFTYNMKYLNIMDLDTNLLTEAPDLTGACQNLLSLYLGQNKISSLPVGYFSGCPKLSTVLIQGNLLTAIPDFSQIGSSLQFLGLAKNSISGTVAADTFENLTKVETIGLDENQIEVYDIANIRHMPSLEKLSLRYNMLKSIGDPYRYCTGLACQELTIDVDYNNNLLCDEQLCWAKRNPAAIQVVMGGCFGKSWAYVTLDDLNCPVTRLVEVNQREGKNVTFRSSLTVDSNLPKSIRDLPSYGICAFWCSEVENCVLFEYVPNTKKTSSAGVCTIRFN